MRLLFIACNPKGADDLRIDEEIREIKERLGANVGIEPIEASYHPFLPIGEIASTISAFAPEVLHITAHGRTDGLSLDNPFDGTSVLHGDQLATLLAGLAVKPKLIVLNACSSAAMARTLAESGAADHVLGTDATITNGGAITLAYTMYERLAHGDSLRAAYDVARTNLELVDKEKVFAKLYGAPDCMPSESLHLVKLPRLLVRLPNIDRWVALGHSRLQPEYNPRLPCIAIGGAGLPLVDCSLLFRSRDQEVNLVGVNKCHAEEGWKKAGRATDGKMWLDRTFECFGDVTFDVDIETVDGRKSAFDGRVSEAIELSYLSRTANPLPPAIRDGVKSVLDHLRK